MGKKITYKSAGVDIDEAVKALKNAKKHIKSTFNKNVGTDIGSFGGVYKITKNKFIVTSTDGVGTKLKIAQELGIHGTVGMDIVNHCVNDILVMGAKPLVFLDYFGTGRLSAKVLVDVIKGMATACRENNTVLIGGETAEMPGVYKPGEYDLVGTIVGEIEKGKIITGKAIKKGDVLIGLPSSGLHTNGYSLARRVFEGARVPYTRKMKELGTTVGKALLKPHRSYLRSVLPMINKFFRDIHGIAHITGGGFYDNIERLLPGNVDCVVFKKAWKVPQIFGLIKKLGKIDDREMYRVFNMGIGLVISVNPHKAPAVLRFLKAKGEKPALLGIIIKGKGKVEVI